MFITNLEGEMFSLKRNASCNWALYERETKIARTVKLIERTHFILFICKLPSTIKREVTDQ